MTDESNPIRWDRGKSHLFVWGARQMGKGALYAGVVFFGCILFVLVWKWISYLLPEDPYALIDAVGRTGAMIA